MIKKRILPSIGSLLSIIPILASLNSVAQHNTQFNTLQINEQITNSAEAYITSWYNNKSGAISISFDDASFTQFEYAYPLLNKYKIKATFSVVGEWAEDFPSFSSEPGYFEIQKMGWKQLAELADEGHEIAAHGYLHEKYDKNKAIPELASEMLKIKSLIESKIDTKVLTIHYPYSFASINIPLAAREAGFLFGRSGLDTINAANPLNTYLLASQPILNNESPDSLEFQKWMLQANGNWLILIYHHLFLINSKEMNLIGHHQVENSYSLLPETFEEQLKMIIASDYWAAPIASIGKYIIERNNTEIKTVNTSKKKYIYTFTNLDTRIYNQPLTIEVDIKWKRVKVDGSLQDGIYEIHNNKIQLNVLPEHELIITKQ